jgi:hypothetical protein
MTIRQVLYFIILTITSCSKQVDNNDSLNKELETAFQNSRPTMNKFMDDWSNESLKMTNSNPTDLEQEFFQIYKIIFSPFDFEKFGWNESGNWTPYSGAKYIVIQSEIPYTIVNEIDTLADFNYMDTLENFIPVVKFENVKTLYLVKQYRTALVDFLGVPQNFEERNVFWEKKEFLEPFIKSSLAYDWRAVLTQPTIDGIGISENFTEATVDFTIMQTGLRSYLIKANGHWTLKTTKMTWIE